MKKNHTLRPNTIVWLVIIGFITISAYILLQQRVTLYCHFSGCKTIKDTLKNKLPLFHRYKTGEVIHYDGNILVVDKITKNK